MTERQAGYGESTVSPSTEPCTCGAKLWPDARYCPLCGGINGTRTGEPPGPDPKDVRITELELAVAKLKREVARLERELEDERADHAGILATCNRGISELQHQLRREREALKLAAGRIAGLEDRLAGRDRDVARLEADVRRLRRPGRHWFWPMVLGALLGLLLPALIGSGGSGGAATPDSVMLGESWAPLDVPEDGAVLLSADRPFRVRGPAGLFVVEPGDSVRLPAGGPLEARAVTGEVELRIEPAS